MEKRFRFFVSLYFIIISIFIYPYTASSTPTKTIHAFIDCATGPMLLEAIHLLQMPKEAPKIIAWDPFPKHPNFNLDKYNISYLTSSSKSLSIDTMGPALREFMLSEIEKDKNIQFIIHTNIFHARETIALILDLKNNIKNIHLYEDGIGNVIASRKDALQRFPLNKNKPPQNTWLLDWPYFLHLTLPVTYHIAYVDKMKTDFPKMANLLEGAEIKEINIPNIKKQLTEDQKKDLANLYNIDIDYYKSLFTTPPNKKTAILLTSRPNVSPEEYQKELNVYKKILKDTHYQYVLKPHPNPASLRFAKDLKKTFQDLVVIDHKIPTEIFYLLDIMPNYISGFSSSVFLTLPKEYFLFYIARKKDTYLPFLLKEGIIQKEQVIDEHLK